MFYIISVEEMNDADQELRDTLRKLWPLHARKGMIDVAVPQDDGLFITLTLNYVYPLLISCCAYLLLQTWRFKS